MFRVFIGIGLAAGLAALGVIAVRAVVERRQQIGVLRSIGFRSGYVGIEMLIEMGADRLHGHRDGHRARAGLGLAAVR